MIGLFLVIRVVTAPHALWGFCATTPPRCRRCYANVTLRSSTSLKL